MDGTLLAASPGGGATKRYASNKNAFIATLIAFLPLAAGQFYNGDNKKGLAVLAGYVFCFLLAGTVVAAWLAVILMFALWGWSVFDAYAVAKCQKALW